MDLDLTDRVVLITGANSPIGIGATTALRFCQEGARVALVYKRLSLPYDPERARLPGLDRYRLLLSDNAQAIERRLRETTEHYTIIEQDIIRVSHAQSPADYVSLGRDVESQVLSRALHAHIHRRVFINGNKTVVFPASPGSYASERMG